MEKPCHYKENKWVSGRKEAWADENALAANVLVWTMNYLIGIWDAERAWGLPYASICNYRRMSMEPRALLPEVRKMTPFSRWELVAQVPEDFWLLSPRNPPVVHGELISGYLDCYLGFGELGSDRDGWGRGWLSQNGLS